MEHFRITKMIEKVAKKVGVDYKSPNHTIINEMQNDIDRLADMFLDLKEIIGELEDLKEKYNKVPIFSVILGKVILRLDEVDHIINKEAQLLFDYKSKLEIK